MATIKSYTDLEQSKKLAEILPIESADMKYPYFGNTEWGETPRFGEPLEYSGNKDKPCWSLAALLGVFSYYEVNNNGVNIQFSAKGESLITEEGECLLDLVVNMIIRLH